METKPLPALIWNIRVEFLHKKESRNMKIFITNLKLIRVYCAPLYDVFIILQCLY